MNYWTWMVLSLLGAGAMALLLSRKSKLTLAALLLGTVLGTAGAKLVYYVTQIDFMLAGGWARSLVNMDPTQWCFFGGCVGATLGVWLAAKICREHPVEALNTFAPAGALMVALSRFSGYFLQYAMIGLGEYVDDPALCFFPLTLVNEWGEHYLAVFMLEGLAALAVMALSLTCLKEKRFLRTVFYLCLPQILLESLHSNSVSWLFVRIEQLLCMLAMAAVLIRYMTLLPAGRARLAPLWITLGCAALFVTIEFALDKSSLPIPLLYGLMAAGLAVMAWVEIRTFRKIRA